MSGFGRITITNPMMGLIAMQVCAEADVTDEEILEYVNIHNPAGTRNGWMQVIHEGNEDYPNAVPVVCEDDKNRKHFIILC